MSNKYAIYTEDLSSNIDQIDRIKSFIKQESLLEDFVIFTDQLNKTNYEYAILNSFYMIAYTGNIIFLDIEDYLQHKDSTNGKSILYIKNIQNIDRSIVKNCRILSDLDNKLMWVDKYELQ